MLAAEMGAISFLSRASGECLKRMVSHVQIKKKVLFKVFVFAADNPLVPNVSHISEGRPTLRYF